ncbi:MAG: hypothetical protein UIM27_04515 [Acutalibacteraceae bacterium]|nr:hypothetical protein [Acutalibacteraceae bacterium]
MMKRISCGILALILTAVLFCGCGTQQGNQEIKAEEIEKYYSQYAPKFGEDVRAVTNEEILALCAVDEEATELLKNNGEGNNQCVIYKPTQELLKVLPDNVINCRIDKMILKDGGPELVYVDYTDDNLTRVIACYYENELKTLSIYFEADDLFVEIQGDEGYKTEDFRNGK